VRQENRGMETHSLELLLVCGAVFWNDGSVWEVNRGGGCITYECSKCS
jgi:hypothetical protein